MAVRVENGEALAFGTFAAEAEVTHFRVTRGAHRLVDGRPLASAVTVGANEGCQFAEGEIDLLFPANELEDAGLKQMIDAEFAHSITVDLMTDATTLVAVSGYAAASSSDWDTSVESDPNP